VTRTDVTSVNTLSQNGLQKGRNGRRTSSGTRSTPPMAADSSASPEPLVITTFAAASAS
jgi:hypothetical protein